MVERKLLLGNEAIARGAFEGGVSHGSGYPGTPSSEILSYLALLGEKYPHIYVEWSTNEAVGFGTAYGAALVGKRSIVTMKHVGLNVAADYFMGAAYTGINAGLVVVSVDDPGCYSSQNEQDNRYYSRLGHIPMLEPSDSQECLDFTKGAFHISEEYDIPVLLRSTMRVSHTRTPVVLGERVEVEPKNYEPKSEKYLCLPGNSRNMRVALEQKLFKLGEESDNSHLNRIELSDTKVGIITSGIVYQYVKEAWPNASILKLGMTHPLPRKKIREFAEKVEKLKVVEELSPFLEEQMLAMGMKLVDTGKISRIGELSPEIIAGIKPNISYTMPRPPKFCGGCYYDTVFTKLKELRDEEGIRFIGDIGCYTLSGLPPYEVLETTLCMGASIPMASAMSREGKYVAVIGDSTFLHTGLPGLANAVHNNYNVTIIITDNKTTAMTGAQDHAGTDYNLMGKESKKIDLKTVVEAMGAKCKRVEVLKDPKKSPNEFKQAVSDAVCSPGVNVVIADGVCLQYARMRHKRE